jgi:hypothetical protein
MKSVIAVGIATIAGFSTPVLAGSNSARSSGSAGVARQAESAPAVSPVTAVLDFPARVRSPGLDRAEQVAGAPVAGTRAPLVAEVRVCIVPSGAVSEVKLTGSSGVPAFDRAIVDSAGTWVYSAYQAPAGVRICSAVSVVYRTRPALASRRAHR